MPGVRHAGQGFGNGQSGTTKSQTDFDDGPRALGEEKIANQVAGKAELVDVVTAISAAESSLETVMAVRDQVINAYQEIMRMPI